MAESLYISLGPPFLFPLFFFLSVCIILNHVKGLNDVAEFQVQFYLSHYSSWERIRVGAQFHMRRLPPHQAVFKEEQQVAAGRGNLRLSGCQSGIAAESRLFI